MKAIKCPICERVVAAEETLNLAVPEVEIVRRRDEFEIKAERMAK